jgi:hypothetical protein
VHGLAFLHLDVKLSNTDLDKIDEQVRSTLAAIFMPFGKADADHTKTTINSTSQNRKSNEPEHRNTEYSDADTRESIARRHQRHPLRG